MLAIAFRVAGRYGFHSLGHWNELGTQSNYKNFLFLAKLSRVLTLFSFFQTKVLSQMRNPLYKKGTSEVSPLFEKNIFCHVASQREGWNISGSKNSSLEASSGSVLKADPSLFAFKLGQLIMVKWS